MTDTNKMINETKNLSLLIVEDELFVRDSLVRYAKKIFAKVEEATDGLDGLQKYKKQKFDLIFADINMPRLNGIEMSREIKKLNPSQNIIIVSAYSEVKFFIESIKIGVDGYVLKPVMFEQMNEVVYKSAKVINEARELRRYKNSLERIIDEKTKKIKKLYTKDSLTGLLNRSVLTTKLNNEIKSSMILVDVENFSQINEVYGVEFGDCILLNIALKLKSFKSDGVEIFRYANDEFILLLDKNLKEALKIAQEIEKLIGVSLFECKSIKKKISLKIGVDYDWRKNLLKQTLIAIDEANFLHKKGINKYHKNSKFELMQKEHIKWGEKIDKALEESSFVPYYQAILNNKNRKIEKYECLARLISGDKAISPALFLDYLQINNTLPSLTRIIIDKSFAYMKDFNFNFSINITDQDLTQNYLLEYLKSKFEEHNIAPQRLTLEILENLTVLDDKLFFTQIKEFKKLGVSISIDDFGTQSSNFSRLLEIEADYIKIDGSFIKNIHKDKKSQIITKSIVEFAKSINSKIIAEFVCNQEVANYIEKLNIEYSQGYYISEPKKEILKS